MRGPDQQLFQQMSVCVQLQSDRVDVLIQFESPFRPADGRNTGDIGEEIGHTESGPFRVRQTHQLLVAADEFSQAIRSTRQFSL